MRDREVDEYDQRLHGYGNVSNGDGRYLTRWVLVLFSGLILVMVTAAIAWAVSESGRVSALEVAQAAINAKLDHIIRIVDRRHGP